MNTNFQSAATTSPASGRVMYIILLKKDVLAIFETRGDEIVNSISDSSRVSDSTVFICIRRLVRAWAKEGASPEKVSVEQLLQLLNFSAVRIVDVDVARVRQGEIVRSLI